MKKSAFLFLLSALIISTSLFLIIESAKYYQKFYPSAWQPIFLSILLESFVLVLAMSRVYKLPLRIVQKILMGSVFIIIVATASLHHVSPIIQSISESKNQDKIATIIENELQNLKDDLSIFNKQDQKLNSAQAANRRHTLSDTLISAVSKSKRVSVSVYFDITVLILIRLILQCCNLFCGSMMGSYYRKRKIKPILKNKVEVQKFCECGCGRVVSSGKRYILGHNLVPGKKKQIIKLRPKKEVTDIDMKKEFGIKKP